MYVEMDGVAGCQSQYHNAHTWQEDNNNREFLTPNVMYVEMDGVAGCKSQYHNTHIWQEDNNNRE